VSLFVLLVGEKFAGLRIVAQSVGFSVSSGRGRDRGGGVGHAVLHVLELSGDFKVISQQASSFALVVGCLWHQEGAHT